MNGLSYEQSILKIWLIIIFDEIDGDALSLFLVHLIWVVVKQNFATDIEVSKCKQY